MADAQVESRLKEFIESDNIAALLVDNGETDLLEKIGRNAVQQYELDDGDEVRTEKKKSGKKPRRLPSRSSRRKILPMSHRPISSIPS